MYFGFDPLHLMMVLPALLISAWAAWRIRSTFRKFSAVPARSGLSGAEAAHRILHENGAGDVQIEAVPGNLSDHYDPRTRVLRLSSDVYASRSIAALAVAAHEAGHALQHAQGYAPLQMRSALVPLASIGSNLSWILFIVGMLLSQAAPTIGRPVLFTAIALFSVSVLFTLVTLPVEFDASRRALLALEHGGHLAADEITPARKVLRAAAFTYLAAALMAVMELLYFLIRSGLLGGRRSD